MRGNREKRVNKDVSTLTSGMKRRGLHKMTTLYPLTCYCSSVEDQTDKQSAICMFEACRTSLSQTTPISHGCHVQREAGNDHEM